MRSEMEKLHGDASNSMENNNHGDVSSSMENNHEDSLDARGYLSKFSKVSLEPSAPLLKHSVESEDYSMDYPNRGRCLIFNHKTFEPQTKLNTRNGTDEDCAKLYCLFRKLGFDVSINTDLTTKAVLNYLKTEGKKDHSTNACFICCILTHGDDGILFASDGKYSTEQVFAPFHGDKCPTLVGKPKIFFIQACQGDKLDKGAHVAFSQDKCQSADSDNYYKIPSRADFLAVFSTVPGFYSWRNTSNGSWFIQSLWSVLDERAKDMDLLEMLTVVCRKVAYYFESCTPDDPCMDRMKQVPFVTSTLTRKVKYHKVAE